MSEHQTPALSARRIAGLLGVTLGELASLIGVTHRALSATENRGLHQALNPVARILAMAVELAGSEQRAAIWFKHQPLPGWAGKTAYDLVHEGKGDTVLAYLEAVRSGVYA